MIKRVILPAEADEKMLRAAYEAGRYQVNSGRIYSEYSADPAELDEGAPELMYAAMRDASPNAGKVTEAELERMLAAKPFEDGDETVEKIIILGLAACGFKLPSAVAPDVICAALASLGLEVEG